MLCSPQRYDDRLISGVGLTFLIRFSQLDGIRFQTSLILFKRKVGGVIFNLADSNRTFRNNRGLQRVEVKTMKRKRLGNEVYRMARQC